MRKIHIVAPLAALVAAVAVGAAAPRTARAQMFQQCPAVNLNTGCGALITIGPGGVLSIAVDAVQGPYDGSDDALIGVVNNSGLSVNSMTLVTGTDAFGFDGDGLCSYNLVCTWAHPTGYEGPITSFTNINAAATSGTVVFAGGLAAGASTYFSLEETPAALAQSGVGGGVNTTPEPATLGLVAVGMGLVGTAVRRRRRA